MWSMVFTKPTINELQKVKRPTTPDPLQQSISNIKTKKKSTEESNQIHFSSHWTNIYSHEEKINNNQIILNEERIQVEREESIKTKLHNFHRKKWRHTKQNKRKYIDIQPTNHNNTKHSSSRFCSSFILFKLSSRTDQLHFSVYLSDTFFLYRLLFLVAFFSVLSFCMYILHEMIMVNDDNDDEVIVHSMRSSQSYIYKKCYPRTVWLFWIVLEVLCKIAY